MTNNITGTGVALVTPFKTDKTIDFDALRKVTNHVIEGGVEYLVALGTTGETATLSHEEKKEVIQTITDANNKRVPLIVGIGGNNTAAIIKSIEETNLDNVSGILSVSPYYNKPSQKGIYEHFSAISNTSPLPIIVYNVPGRTGSNIAAETIVSLAKDCNNIIAVKEASGDLNQVMQIIKNKPQGFKVFSGDDALTLSITLLGGDGVISVIANSHPKPFSDMVRSALNQNCSKANDLHYSLLDLIHTMFEEGNPAGVKAALEILGICQAEVRLPLVRASKTLKEKIKLQMNDIK